MPRNGGSPIAIRRSPQRQASVPGIAQAKLAAKAPLKQRPPAPPVYRPQQVPKVLQTKKPAGPPAYRPQTIPKVLQARNSNQPLSISRAKVKGQPRITTPVTGSVPASVRSPQKTRPLIAQSKTRANARLEAKASGPRNQSPQARSNLLQLKPLPRGGNQVIQRLLITYLDPKSNMQRDIETDFLNLSALQSELERAKELYKSIPDALVDPRKDRLRRAVSMLELESKERELINEVDAVRARCDGRFLEKHVVLNAASDAERLRRAWEKCVKREGEVFQNTVLFFNSLELVAFERAAMLTFQRHHKAEAIYVVPYDIPLLAHSTERYPNKISIWKNARVKVTIKKNGPNHADIVHLDDVGGGTKVAFYRFDRDRLSGKRVLIDLEHGYTNMVYLD